MSAAVNEEIYTVQCCASCGIAGIDDIKLKDCDECDLVKYCSDECQEDHRPQHKEECMKRAAELRDEILFKQPESSSFGDCPICCLPLPIDVKKTTSTTCCSKLICKGCSLANTKREVEGRLQHKCPFCREALVSTQEEADEQRKKRIEANDPVAICDMGTIKGLEGDYSTAFEYFTRAAALGDVNAHYQLSILYQHGKGVEKNEKKEFHHLTEATIGGHPAARFNLGCKERESRRMNRAVSHWIIASKLGEDNSLENIKVLYKAGYLSKDVFATALLGYQAAIEATKSPQREEAYEVAKKWAEHNSRGV